MKKINDVSTTEYISQRAAVNGSNTATAGAGLAQQEPGVHGQVQMRPTAQAVEMSTVWYGRKTWNGWTSAAAGAAALPAQQLVPQLKQRTKAVVVQGQEPLTQLCWLLLSLQKQKQMLGEQVFSLIQTMHADLASKVTGMLLENNNSELLHM